MYITHVLHVHVHIDKMCYMYSTINYALLHKILNFMYIVHVIMYNNYYTLLFLLFAEC